MADCCYIVTNFVSYIYNHKGKKFKMINFLVGLFLYAIIGTIVFKVTNKVYNINLEVDDDGRPFIFGIFWPFCIPLILVFYITVYSFKHIIDPFTDKIINKSEKKIENYCKNKKDRNID